MERETKVYREGHGVVTKSRAAEIDAAARSARNILPTRSEILDGEPVQRGSWVMRKGKLLTRREAMIQDFVEGSKNRGEHPAPMIQADIAPYKNMIDGRVITSRSHHRELLKRHNCIEVGNEYKAAMGTPVATQKGEIAREIKDTIEQLKSGYVNPDEGVLPAGDALKSTETMELPANVANGDYFREDVLPAE
jgi:hypothetical protein